MIAHVTDWADSIGAVRMRRPLSRRSSWKVLTAPAMLPKALQRAEDRLGAELDRLGGHALVGSVDQRHEAEVAGQLERQEAVILDPELGEEAGVGDAGLQQWHGHSPGLELPDDLGERLELVEPGLRRPRV